MTLDTQVDASTMILDDFLAIDDANVRLTLLGSMMMLHEEMIRRATSVSPLEDEIAAKNAAALQSASDEANASPNFG